MTRGPVLVDIAWDPQALHGPALATADVLRVVQTLAAMRGAGRPAVAWRWVCAPGRRAPAALPRGPQVPRAAVADVAVLPGWAARNGPHLDRLVREQRWLAPRLRQVHAAGGAVVAVHNAVAQAADAGLLEGREAVAPWAFLPSVLRHAPGLRVCTDAAWMQDGRVWTGDSPVLATEMVLDALRLTALEPLAQAAAHALLHSPQRQKAAATAGPVRGVPAGAVERARRHLEAHLAAPYDLPALAREAATSPRTLLRHFEATHGKTPLAYLRELRMAQARLLLETSYLPVEQVAQACGYPHPGTFRRQFTQATGAQPAAYRERYRLRVRRREWGRDAAP